MNNNLILRTVNSPFGDVTKGTVLSQNELDDNFIYLKGNNILTATTDNGIVTLTKINGNNITFQSGAASITQYWTSGTSGSNSIKVINKTSTDATGDYSLAEGSDTLASGISSHAEGNGTVASGNYSHTEGNECSATTQGAHAEGNSTLARGQYSHTEGNATRTIGNYSHAEGNATTGSSLSSHAEGTGTFAGGESSSHAEGNYTVASGSSSHSEGSYTIASGHNSHAEGTNTQAIGYTSHAEGDGTIASGITSHAEGSNTTAIGDYSHSEGRNTEATKQSSSASGEWAKANNVGEHAFSSGQFESIGLSSAQCGVMTFNGRTSNQNPVYLQLGGTYGYFTPEPSRIYGITLTGVVGAQHSTQFGAMWGPTNSVIGLVSVSPSGIPTLISSSGNVKPILYSIGLEDIGLELVVDADVIQVKVNGHPSMPFFWNIKFEYTSIYSQVMTGS